MIRKRRAHLFGRLVWREAKPLFPFREETGPSLRLCRRESILALEQRIPSSKDRPLVWLRQHPSLSLRQRETSPPPLPGRDEPLSPTLSERVDSCSRAKNPIVEGSMIGLASPRPLPLTSSKRDKSSSLSGRRRAHHRGIDDWSGFANTPPFDFVKKRQAPLSDNVGESRFLLSSKKANHQFVDASMIGHFFLQRMASPAKTNPAKTNTRPRQGHTLFEVWSV